MGQHWGRHPCATLLVGLANASILWLHASLCLVIHRQRQASQFITMAEEAVGATTIGQLQIKLSCRQQLHIVKASLTACWLTGQAKSPLDVTAKKDVDCLQDLAQSCWAS
jgi:hypothetical protein